MWLRMAALAALAAASCLSARAQTPPFTLDEAFGRVARVHPDLRLLRVDERILAAEREGAGLRPPMVAGLEVENALGTGTARGFGAAEVTLSLAGVLEGAGKLDARRAVAQVRIDALAVEREARRLDLLAEVARRYVAIVVAQQRSRVAELDIAQRRAAIAAAQRRLQAGASPESVLLTAEAALARAEMEHERALQEADAARRYLATLWGDYAPDLGEVAGDLPALPAMADFAALAQQLARNPDLQRFDDQRRLRDAQLHLARLQSRPDPEWSLGLRRLGEGGDLALVGSIAVPLGSARRAGPGIRAAEAERARLDIEREAEGMNLHAALAAMHGRYRVARLEVQRLREAVQPRLAKAEAAAARAYRAGAASYLEWAQLQSDRIQAHRQEIDSAQEARAALIEIQRLTGESAMGEDTASTRGDLP